MRKFKRAKDIRVGVIGYGGAFNMGKSHLMEMKGAGMTPVAVAEIDRARLKVAREDFPGIETYSSVTAMLKKSDVNLVTIITPHNTHAKLALQCLRAGRSVVCEKPMAITTAECDAMIAAAKKKRVLLSVYHNRHWDGCILRAVKEIRKGVIGNVVRIEAHMGGWKNPGNWWRTSKKISGGILYDWGVHLLEYSLQIIGSEITEVTGFAKKGFWAPKTKWKKDTHEDEGFAVARFRSGAWLTLCISNVDSNPKEGVLEIMGTKGTYIMGLGDWKVVKPGRDGKPRVKEGKNPASEGWRYYKNVANYLTGKTKLVITPEWARRPTHILDLADKSVRKKKSLKTRYK